MQITVFGASGKVGSLVVEEALRRGYDVVAFVHSHNLFTPSGKLTVVQGDVYNSADVKKALQGSDAVISCLGSWGTPRKNVLTAAMSAIIPAMTEQKIKRIVTLTGSGAIPPGEQKSALHKLLLRLPLPLGAHKVFADGEAHMVQLVQSGLDWTTLRSPVMNNVGPRGYLLDTRRKNLFSTIQRIAVADALLDEIELNQYIAQAPTLFRSRYSSYGHLPKVY